MNENSGAQALYAAFVRIGKICRRQLPPDRDYLSEQMVFGLLFHEYPGTAEAGVRMTDVSRYLMISRPAATQAVDRLEKRGLVERVRDGGDRRSVRIRPSAAGREEFARNMACGVAYITRVIARMGVDEAAQLAALNNKFADALLAESVETEENQCFQN